MPMEPGLPTHRVITDKVNGTWYKLRIPNNYTNSTSPPIVVCVHGIGSAHIDFDNLGIFLCEQNYKVLSYDLIGRGNSDFPDDRNSFDGIGHANQLRELITNLNFQKYSLISHSMGGSIAALYAEQYPKEISSLTFLSPAGLMDLGPLAIVRALQSFLKVIIKLMLKSSQEKAWRESFVAKNGKIANDYVIQMNEVYQQNPIHFYGFWKSAMQCPLSGIDSSIQFLGSTSFPIHLLWGMKDTTVPPNPNLNRWLKLLGDSSLIQKTQHDELAHGFFIEDSTHVNSDILLFLQTHTAS